MQAFCGLLRSLPALADLQCCQGYDDDYFSLGSVLPALCNALLQRRTLTRLEVSVDAARIDKGEIGPRVSASLGQLLNLRSLHLELAGMGQDDEGSRPLLMALGALQELTQLCLGGKHLFSYFTLPAAITRLHRLEDLSLHEYAGISLERGWSHLPALRRLELYCCEFCTGRVQGSEELYWGLRALPALCRLQIVACSSVCLPAGLPGLTSLYVEATCFSVDDVYCAVTPDTLSLGGLRTYTGVTELHLVGLGLRACPHAVTDMLALRELDLTGNLFAELPANVARLSALRSLALGWRAAPAGHAGGCVDISPLDGLSCFPDLQTLVFTDCVVRASGALVDAPSLQTVRFIRSLPDTRASMEAVLQLHRRLVRAQSPGCSYAWVNAGIEHDHREVMRLMGRASGRNKLKAVAAFCAALEDERHARI